MTLTEMIEKFDVNLDGVTATQAVSLCSVIEKQGKENVTNIGCGMQNVLFVEANGMTIGIEPDGYAHT